MTKTKAENNSEIHTNKRFLTGLARAFAGAILFSFPIIMTMEMWWLGFTIDHYRLALFIIFAIPLLIGLSYFIGFEDTSSILDDVVDAFVAFAVGFATSATMLFLLNLVDFTMSSSEIIGKISIQAVVAAIGAMLAQSELGANKEEKEDEDRQRRNTSYAGELFLMMVGAIFLAMNPAPTEEIVLIGHKMTETSVVMLAIFSIVLMHVFVYNVGFRGQEEPKPEDSSFWSVFLRFTMVGYALVLVISLYLVWTFGHIQGLNFADTVKITIIMAFPGALGAAASRLII